MLGPGDCLFVPRHWWHHVDALTHSVSVNTWMPHPLDHRERVSEALVRLLVSSLHGALAAPAPVNKRHKPDGYGYAVGGHPEGTATDKTAPSAAAASRQPTTMPAATVGGPYKRLPVHPAAMAAAPPAGGWLNPGEELYSATDNMLLLNAAIAGHGGGPTGGSGSGAPQSTATLTHRSPFLLSSHARRVACPCFSDAD